MTKEEMVKEIAAKFPPVKSVEDLFANGVMAFMAVKGVDPDSKLTGLDAAKLAMDFAMLMAVSLEETRVKRSEKANA